MYFLEQALFPENKNVNIYTEIWYYSKFFAILCLFLACFDMSIIPFNLFFGQVLHCTNTLKVTWRLSSFTGGGRSQASLHALFQAQMGTKVTFHQPELPIWQNKSTTCSTTACLPGASFYLNFLVKKGHNSKTIVFRVISPCLVAATCHDVQVFQVWCWCL